MKLKVLELFAGLGGFSLGLERAGMMTVASCEIDPACQAVLKHHWPDVPIFPDVTKLNQFELMERINHSPDLICGGYPCTGHSVAGKKKGFDNEGSSLWREYLRLAQQIKPRYCIIENSHNLRSTGLAELLQAFNEIGYDAEWSIISGYSVGAPHQRERIYIVFWRRDIPYPNPFRCWQADPEKEETSQGWWAKRRIKRDSVFRQVSQVRSRVLQLADGVSENLVKAQEYKIAMLGNALIPQIPELIGRALVEHEAALNA